MRRVHGCVFEKAGKERPVIPSWQPVPAHYIMRSEPEFKPGDEVLVYDNTLDDDGPMAGCGSGSRVLHRLLLKAKLK